MGLYIPDLRLPADGDFELWIAVRKDGSFTYNIRGGWQDGKQKAVPVHEPHGRLIDKDALDIYQRAEAAYAEYQEDEDNLYLEGMANGLCEAAKQLSTARTVIHASKEG